MKGLLDLVADDAAYYPVHSCLLSHLDIQDIFNLQRVCKETSTLYKTLLSTQWNIERLLKPYFSDVPAFRALQARTGILINGTAALYFFSRSQFPATTQPLQLFVQRGADGDTVHEYLIAQGYSAPIVDDDNDHSSHSDLEVADVYTKHADDPDRFPFVQLFRVSGPPIAVILQNIRTAWDACFITWNKAYCLFPVSSFITHEPFLLAPLKEVTTPDEEGKVLATREHLTRAHEWGRRIKTGLWQLDTGNKLVPLKELGPYRQLGDKHSWIINLDTKGVKSNPDRPDFLLENMRTFLRHTHDDSPVSYLDPSHYFIESCVLRHAYIACDFSNAAHHPACMCLPDERKTHEQGVQQLLKMLQEATVV